MAVFRLFTKSQGEHGTSERCKRHGRKDRTPRHAYFLLCPFFHGGAMSACQKGFDKLVDGDASCLPCSLSVFALETGFSAAKIVPLRSYTLLVRLKIREGSNPLELSKGFSTVCDGSASSLRHSHPYQFLMNSSDFRAQKLQGNDFCSGKWEFLPQNRPLFTRHRIRWTSERALTLSSSPRLFDSPSWRSHVIRCRSEPALPIDFRDESQKRARPPQKQRTIRSAWRFSGRIRHYSMENSSL